jgi:hypothetical protein
MKPQRSVEGRRALEVVVCLEDSIVDVIHLRTPGQVRAGSSPGCQVALPASALDGADSVVIASLDSTGTAYAARELSGGTGLAPLGDDENRSLENGKVRVFARWAPDVAGDARAFFRPDKRTATVLLASLVGHAVFLWILFAIPPDAKALVSWERYKEARNIAVKLKPTEDPLKELHKGTGEEGKDTATDAKQSTAAATGEQGKQGRTDSPKDKGRTTLKGTMAEDKPGRGDAHAWVQNKGVLGVMRTVDWAPVAGGEDEWGSHDQYAYGPSQDGEPGDGRGNFGGGFEGDGTGGCPPGSRYCLDGSIGTGKYKTIGNSPGDGYDPDGTGTRVKMGPKGDNGPVIKFQPPTVGPDGLDKAMVKRTVQKYKDRIAYCYSRQLQVNEDLEGTVGVDFVISPQGNVISVVLFDNTVEDKAVGSCVGGVVENMQFPASEGMTKVKYPFTFHAVGSR